ncbi:MAG: hypothetical protein IKG46_12870 [Solobacterium sp.]|nr:hypothetical protein [Solobacterium sp.]
MTETERLLKQIREAEGPLRIAVDGRCASGKSTFAARLAEMTGADVLHMDDFFLRPEQRSEERYRTPGGNVDHERFLEQVLVPLSEGREYTYQPFDCRIMELGTAEVRRPSRITITEGSYSLHPLLKDYYDIKVFLTVQQETQIERIRKRNPDKVQRFIREWIPYEELYFREFDTENQADIVIDTTDLF